MLAIAGGLVSAVANEILGSVYVFFDAASRT